MQDKLKERAAAREQAMEIVQKMDEIYDKLQSITKKQSLIRKTSYRIRLGSYSCFGSLAHSVLIACAQFFLFFIFRPDGLPQWINLIFYFQNRVSQHVK